MQLDAAFLDIGAEPKVCLELNCSIILMATIRTIFQIKRAEEMNTWRGGCLFQLNCTGGENRYCDWFQ